MQCLRLLRLGLGTCCLARQYNPSRSGEANPKLRLTLRRTYRPDAAVADDENLLSRSGRDVQVPGEFAECRQHAAVLAEHEARQPQPLSRPASQDEGGMQVALEDIAAAATAVT